MVAVAGLVISGSGAAEVFTPHERPRPPVNRGTLTSPNSIPATFMAHTATPASAVTIAPPVHLRIPRIGIDTALTELHVQDDGRLTTPDDPDQAGWWSEGPRPGQEGAALIVGHVDSLRGPAVFYGLSSLSPGDTVLVDRSDHTTATFTVQALRQYPKDAIPSDEVYADDGPAALRLITCGGTFDHRREQYLDNLVVFAGLSKPS